VATTQKEAKRCEALPDRASTRASGGGHKVWGGLRSGRETNQHRSQMWGKTRPQERFKREKPNALGGILLILSVRTRTKTKEKLNAPRRSAK